MTSRLLAFATVLALAGCGPFESRSSYFNGGVIVEYKQTRSRSSDDYITIRFYETGDYEIAFDGVPGKRQEPDRMPKSIKVAIIAPREIIIRQYVLPDYVRVRIIFNGQAEEHDFS